MSEESLIVRPSFPYGTYILPDDTKATAPEGWELLPPGDAGLTRRVKAAGPSWTVQTKKGRKTFSQGVLAPAETIAAERERLEAERETPEYKRKLEQGRARREREQENYVEDFQQAILDYLAFPPRYAEIAEKLAAAVAEHATPVGSGTVARTKRIPIEDRAEAALIAWMRHRTTAYDSLSIPRGRGKRRQVRAMLAKESKRLLAAYRRGVDLDPSACPLALALA